MDGERPNKRKKNVLFVSKKNNVLLINQVGGHVEDLFNATYDS